MIEICDGCYTSFDTRDLTQHRIPMANPYIAKLFPEELKLSCPACEITGRWKKEYRKLADKMGIDLGQITESPCLRLVNERKEVVVLTYQEGFRDTDVLHRG